MKMIITVFLPGALAVSIQAAGPRFSDWSAPVNLGPVINTEFHDQHPAISKNGLSLYFISTRPGGFGDYDIWVSQRASIDNPWGLPQNLGPNVNTSYEEFSPTLSRDGHWLLFCSMKPGGFGAGDIYASYREHTHDDFAWQPPINLGAGVNSAFDECGPTLFEDEETGMTTLYFTSLNRPGNIGDWDIYASVLGADGLFGHANLVVELNSPGRETRSAIRHNGLEIIFVSNRPGGQGSADLWASTRETAFDPWSKPFNLGPIVNTSFFDGAPALSSDGETLFFYSNRPGGYGGNDLYMSTRRKLHGRSE